MDRLGDLVVGKVASQVVLFLKELDYFASTYEATENGFVRVR